MQSLLNRVAENNNLGDLRLPTFNPASHGDDPSADTLIPFVLDDCTHGYVTPAFAAHCCRFPSVFFLKSFVGLCLVPAVAAGSLQQRTAAVAAVTAALRDAGVITGWRDELLATGPNGGFVLPPAARGAAAAGAGAGAGAGGEEDEDEGGAALLMERAAFPHFGLKGYGVHVNGYVLTPEGPQLWVAIRSPSKQTWPGAYDHIAAGALPYDLSPIENVIKVGLPCACGFLPTIHAAFHMCARLVHSTYVYIYMYLVSSIWPNLHMSLGLSYLLRPRTNHAKKTTSHTHDTHPTHTRTHPHTHTHPNRSVARRRASLPPWPPLPCRWEPSATGGLTSRGG